MNKYLKSSLYLLVAILVGVTVTYAAPGSKLTPPGVASNTMYSLTDIFNLSTGQTATLGIGDIETTPALTETGKTLTEVYTAISSEIFKLSSSVLKSGTTVFGITGSTSVVDTFDADANESNILLNKTAYVNGVKITGSATIENPMPIFSSSDTDSIRGKIVNSCIMVDRQDCQNGNYYGCYYVSDEYGMNGYCEGTYEEITETPIDVFNWAEAETACESLTEGGYNNWRLPTYLEMVKYYLTNNVNGSVATFNPNSAYWTSTPLANSSSWMSIYMGQNFGEVASNPFFSSYAVRCVR